jgi:hypothetical protein
VALGEVRWTPAMNRSADILGRADDSGEDDEEEDSVAVVEAINEVVIITNTTLGQLGYRRYHPIHPGGVRVSSRLVLERTNK